MYVMDIKKGREKADISSESFLQINSAGVAIGDYKRFQGDCRIFRAEGRADWQIQLVTEGTIDLYNGDIHYTLKPGDCFIIPPGVVNDYIYRIKSSKSQSMGYYVHFSGTAAKEIMDRLNVSGIAVLRNVSGDVSRIFELLFYTYRSGQELAALGELLKIISALSAKGHSELSETKKAILAEADYINKHYTQNIDFERMAARCNLSRSRFTHVFSDTFGEPPSQYQLRLKFEQAGELLRHSTLTVGEIAAQCGFSDVLYFSSMFSKRYGVSPTKFRGKK